VICRGRKDGKRKKKIPLYHVVPAFKQYAGTGGAVSADILHLIHHVQQTVKNKFGVALEPEVRCIGEF